MSLRVSVDVKQQLTMLRHWSPFVPNMSTDIRGHEIYIIITPPASEFGTCVKAEVDVQGSTSLTVLTDSVDEKQH